MTVSGSKWLWKWAALLSGRRSSPVLYSCAHHKGFCSSVQVLKKCPHDCPLKSKGILTHHIVPKGEFTHSTCVCGPDASFIDFQVGASTFFSLRDSKQCPLYNVFWYFGPGDLVRYIGWISKSQAKILHNFMHSFHLFFFNFVFLPRNLNKKIIASENYRVERSLEIL